MEMCCCKPIALAWIWDALVMACQAFTGKPSMLEPCNQVTMFIVFSSPKNLIWWQWEIELVAVTYRASWRQRASACIFTHTQTQTQVHTPVPVQREGKKVLEWQVGVISVSPLRCISTMDRVHRSVCVCLCVVGLWKADRYDSFWFP